MSTNYSWRGPPFPRWRPLRFFGGSGYVHEPRRGPRDRPSPRSLPAPRPEPVSYSAGTTCSYFGAPLTGAVLAQSVAGGRNLTKVVQDEIQAGAEAKRPAAEVLPQTKRAMVDAVARFLFKCPPHRGVLRTGYLVVVFPTCSEVSAAPNEPDPEEQASAAGSAAISVTERSRADGGTVSLRLLLVLCPA